MAQLPTNVEIRTPHTVDPAERSYGFSFLATDPAQVKVDFTQLDGSTTALALGTQYSVLLSDDEGGGGSIRLLNSEESPQAVTLVEGQALTIWRDTTVAGTTDLVQGVQELVESRPTTERVNTIVGETVADWAEEGNTDFIPRSKLGNVPVATPNPVPADIEQALLAPSLTLGGGNTNLVGVSFGAGNDADVDLIPFVRQTVQSWAVWDHPGPIPTSALPPLGLDAAAVKAAIVADVQSWALDATTRIPDAKLPTPTIDVQDEGSPRGTVDTLNVVGADVELTVPGAGTTAVLTVTVPPRGLNQTEVNALIMADVRTWARMSGTGDLFSASGNVETVEVSDGWALQYDLPPITWHLDTLVDGVFSNFPLSLSAGIIGNSAQLPGTFIIDGVNLNLRGPGYDSAQDTFRITLDQGVNLPLLNGYALDITNDATPPATHRLLFADVFEAQVDPADSDRRILVWRGVPADIVTVGTNDFSILVPVGRRSYVPSPTDTDMVGWVLKLGTGKVPGWAAETGSPGMGGGSLSLAAVQTEIDTRVPTLVEDFAEVGQSATIPDARFGDDLPSKWDDDVNTLADGRVTAGVKSWARTGGGMVPDNQIPSGIARDSEIPTDTRIRTLADGRVALWARAVSPSGTIPDARIPAGIARDSEIPGDTDIDARIATWARANSPSGMIPDGTIPATIARDAEIVSWARATSPSGTIPNARLPNTFPTKWNGAVDTRADGRVTAGVEDWARDDSTPIPAAKLANAPGGLDVEDSGASRSPASGTDTINFRNGITVTQSGAEVTVDADVTTTAVTTAITDRVEQWARTATGGGSGRIPAARALAPPASNTEIDNGVVSTVRSWSSAAIRRAINAVVPSWARDGDTSAIPDGKLPALVTEAEVQRTVAGTARRLFSVARVRDAIDFSVQNWARDTTTLIPAAKLTNALGGATAGFVKGVGALPGAVTQALRDLWLAPDGLYERTVTAGSNTLSLTNFSSSVIAGTGGNANNRYAGWQASGTNVGAMPAGNYGARFGGLPEEVVGLFAVREGTRATASNVRYYLLLAPGTASDFFGSEVTITDPGGTGTTGDTPRTITLSRQSSMLVGHPWYNGIVTGGTVGALQSVFGPLDGSVNGNNVFTVSDAITLTSQSGMHFGGGVPNWTQRIAAGTAGRLRGTGPLPAVTAYSVGDAWLVPDAGLYTLTAGTPNVWTKQVDAGRGTTTRGPSTVAVSQTLKTTALVPLNTDTPPVRRTTATGPHPTILSNIRAQMFTAASLATGYGSYVDTTGDPVGDANRPGTLNVPSIAPEGATGFWIVCKVGGVELSSVYMPYTPGITRDDPVGYAGTETQTFLLVRPQATESPASDDAVIMRIRMNMSERRGVYTIFFDAETDENGRGCAANTTIEVYLAGTFDEVAAVPDEWEVLTQAAYTALGADRVAGKVYFIDG